MSDALYPEVLLAFARSVERTHRRHVTEQLDARNARVWWMPRWVWRRRPALVAAPPTSEPVRTLTEKPIALAFGDTFKLTIDTQLHRRGEVVGKVVTVFTLETTAVRSYVDVIPPRWRMSSG